MPWPTNFIFGAQIHFQNIQVNIEYQGHEVEVKVIQTWPAFDW